MEWGGVGVEMKVNHKKAAVKVKLESRIRVLVQRQKRMNIFKIWKHKQAIKYYFSHMDNGICSMCAFQIIGLDVVPSY